MPRLDNLLILMVREHCVVEVHNLIRLALHGDTATIEQDGARTDALNGLLVMTDQQQRGALTRELSNAVETLVLEVCITHRQRFVDDQYLRAPCGSDAECQAHLHAAGVDPYRLLEVIANFGKPMDLFDEFIDL